jgi:nitroreductase
MNELLKLMQDRQSSRMPFDDKHKIEKKDLQKILEAARWTPTAHNMQNFEIIVVEDEKILQTILKIKRPISETFIRENYNQLSFSEEELLKKKTGILASNFPPSWRVPDFKLDKKEDAFIQRPFPSCSCMLIVVYDPAKRAPASEGDFLGIISLGCVMENMWLMANSLGIGFHILSSLSAETVEEEVKKILKIPENLKIAFSCRLGYPESVSPESLRVRRDIQDFTSYNKFGGK